MPAFELTLTVNGKEVSRDIEPRTLLAEFLREDLGLTGTHIGCDTTQCGCCTVHMDGRAVKSCTVLAGQANGASVTTIEGIEGEDGALHPMQQAFIDNHALQCGFCTPGMVMSAVAIAERNASLDGENVRHELEGNLCRCTGYVNIVSAVIDGAGRMKPDGG